MQLVPIYVLSANGERSPVNDHPFCLFNPQEDAQILEKEYGIPRRYLGTIMSPWAAKRLHEFGGDITKFRVVKVWPSILQQIAIAKTEPGDENNRDISALVGKVDIRKLEHYAQNDPDAYGYSGALCRANQGIMEFVEMFKAPIKVLHPLLTATQEGNYNGTEGISALPFNGLFSPTRTNPNGSLSVITKQRSLPRPCLHREGAVLLTHFRRDQNLREIA